MKEEFKEYEYQGLKYKVSNTGKVFGVRGELKQRINKDGYKEVTLGSGDKRTTFRIHRLVAICFISNPNNLPEVNHKDYNRTNNSVDNLEWVSHKDNVNYSSDNGRYKNAVAGEINGRAKTSNEEARKIRNLYNQGYRIMDIIKILHPDLSYKERKSLWSRIKAIAVGETFKNI